MAKYSAVLSKRAQRQLDKLSNDVAAPIFLAILALEENPRPPGYKKLKGREGYRIRAGDYRVIYEIVDAQLVIDVITIGHRKDVYKT